MGRALVRRFKKSELSAFDYYLKNAPVSARAGYMNLRLSQADSKEKGRLAEDWHNKRILTEAVAAQLMALQKQKAQRGVR